MVILAVLASAMVVLFVIHTETDSSSAELTASGECGIGVNYTFNDGTLEISGTGYMYDYYETNAPWYEYSNSITKIVIGDGITSLGEWAFIKCLNLKELTMPITLNSVKSDAHPTFAGCNAIEKVHFTCGNGGYAYNYAAYPVSNAWYQNTPWYQSRDTLTEIVFDDGIKSIGSDAFRELNITAVNLPETVVYLGNHCFFDCTKLTDLTIPVSLNPFGNKDYPAFAGCVAIENVTFTEGNGTPYDYKNWYGGPSNTGLAPWNMNSANGKKITISDEVTSLGRYMFYGCNIKELTISISFNAVWLDSHPAFEGMYGLEKVTFTPGSGYGYNYAAYEDIDCWYQHTPWYMCKSTLTEIVFDDGVKHIGSDAFRELNITHLVIPDSVESLDNHTFFRCVQLTSLTIPITLNCVYNNTYPSFDQCYAISNLHLTAGKTGIGFDYTEHVPVWATPFHRACKIIIDAGITYIGTNTFEGFAFLGTDGSILKHTAEELSGRVFCGVDGIMYPAEGNFVDGKFFGTFSGKFIGSVDGKFTGYIGDKYVNGRFVDSHFVGKVNGKFIGKIDGRFVGDASGRFIGTFNGSPFDNRIVDNSICTDDD